MIARGEADVAAIDCFTHCLMTRHEPSFFAGTGASMRTDAAPALPYVTSAATRRR